MTSRRWASLGSQPDRRVRSRERDRHTLLIDETVEAYVGWREESAAVWDAYERWEWASAADARLAFAAYCAAVDREERASNVYAGLATRLSGLTPPPVANPA
jgi:hypothetical protein